MPRSDEETNYACSHELDQRLEEETKAAYEWKANWGFLANKQLPRRAGSRRQRKARVWRRPLVPRRRIPDDGGGHRSSDGGRDFGCPSATSPGSRGRPT